MRAISDCTPTLAGTAGFSTLPALVVLPALLACTAPAEDARPLRVEETAATTDDGVRLHVRIVGDGPQTVLVPVGFYLEDLLAPLADPGRTLVFYDPRGRGRSDAVDSSQVSLKHQLADLDAVRRHVGAERVALIGWSGLGMELAVYAIRHPDRVTRLVQVAPVPPSWAPHTDRAIRQRQARMDSAAAAAFVRRRDAGEFEGRPEEECRAQERVVGPVNFHDPSLRARVADVCTYENEWPSRLGPFFQALLASYADYDWRDELAGLDVPRLVVHGADDAFPVEGSREWVEGHPEARLIVLEKAGHWPFVERPGAFFPAVDRFLDGEWPAAARGLE